MNILEANRFGRINKEDLLDFEKKNEVTLPEDYKNFLLEFNGGYPEKYKLEFPETDVQWLYGMHDGENWASLFFALEIFAGRIPSWYMPIGYDSGGNLFIMSLFEENKGVIGFWKIAEESPEGGDQYFDNVSLVASSFSEFISMLK